MFTNLWDSLVLFRIWIIHDCMNSFLSTLNKFPSFKSYFMRVNFCITTEYDNGNAAGPCPLAPCAFYNPCWGSEKNIGLENPLEELVPQVAPAQTILPQSDLVESRPFRVSLTTNIHFSLSFHCCCLSFFFYIHISSRRFTCIIKVVIKFISLCQYILYQVAVLFMLINKFSISTSCIICKDYKNAYGRAA